MAAGEPVLRDAPRIDDEADELIKAENKLGELHLDPQFEPPKEIVDVDIHLQPGGYGLVRHTRDVVAGALYENGGNVYSFGQGIGKTDSKAGAVIRHLEQVRPGFAPRRILEIGCSAGAAACAYAAHYVEADVHAIDVGAGMLRYAHARAEAIGVRVVFQQMSGAALEFEDASFDLVVSNNLLHEIGRDNRRAMFREARRVLAPGSTWIFLEHTNAGGWKGRAQTLVNPVWGLFSGGCNINRDILGAFERAGFARLDLLERFHAPVGPSLANPHVIAHAVR